MYISKRSRSTTRYNKYLRYMSKYGGGGEEMASQGLERIRKQLSERRLCAQINITCLIGLFVFIFFFSFHHRSSLTREKERECYKTKMATTYVCIFYISLNRARHSTRRRPLRYTPRIGTYYKNGFDNYDWSIRRLARIKQKGMYNNIVR